MPSGVCCKTKDPLESNLVCALAVPGNQLLAIAAAGKSLQEALLNLSPTPSGQRLDAAKLESSRIAFFEILRQQHAVTRKDLLDAPLARLVTNIVL